MEWYTVSLNAHFSAADLPKDAGFKKITEATMVKGEAFLKHMDINKSVTLKTWLGMTAQGKNEFKEELNFANMPGDIIVDVFGLELKDGMPVYEFKGMKAYCTVMNYFKLTEAQKKQFKTVSAPFLANKEA
jgi:hypothetical protein